MRLGFSNRKLETLRAHIKTHFFPDGFQIQLSRNAVTTAASKPRSDVKAYEAYEPDEQIKLERLLQERLKPNWIRGAP